MKSRNDSFRECIIETMNLGDISNKDDHYEIMLYTNLFLFKEYILNLKKKMSDDEVDLYLQSYVNQIQRGITDYLDMENAENDN